MRYDITVEGPALRPGAVWEIHDAISQAIDRADVGDADLIRVRAIPDTPPVPTRAKWVLHGYVVAALLATLLAVAFGIYRGELFR